MTIGNMNHNTYHRWFHLMVLVLAAFTNLISFVSCETKTIGFIVLQGSGFSIDAYNSLSTSIQEIFSSSSEEYKTKIVIPQFDDNKVIMETIESKLEEGYNTLISSSSSSFPSSSYLNSMSKVMPMEENIFIKNKKRRMMMNKPSTVDETSTSFATTTNLKEETAIDSVYVIGHGDASLVLTQYLASSYINQKGLSFQIDGGILLGGFIQRSLWATFVEKNSQLPQILTVGGSMDGVTRVGRIVESYYRQVISSSSLALEVTNQYPVILLDGVSHASFASTNSEYVEGNKLILENDLKPAISDDEGHESIAGTILNFVNQLNDMNSQYLSVLSQPFLQEGNYFFQRPCYDDKPSPSVPCTVGSPWVMEYPQAIVSGTMELYNIPTDTYDEFHPLNQVTPVHHPEIQTKCSSPINPTTCPSLNVSTVTENFYSILPKNDIKNIEKVTDDGFSFISADEMRVKLKSRQATEIALGKDKKDVKMKETDGASFCAETNSAAEAWVVKLLQEANYPALTSILDRYKSSGLTFQYADDTSTSVYPLWDNNVIEFKINSEENEVTVTAEAMKTNVDYGSLLGGMHYCKLVSPARILEWYLREGLINKLGYN